MKTLDEKTQSEINQICHKALDFISQMKQTKTKLDLLEAGKTLSGINYSLLGILKEHELEVVNSLVKETLVDSQEIR